MAAQEQQLRVVLLSPSAKAPYRATEGAAGYDLFCSRDTVIEAREHDCVSTDLIVAVPSGHYGRIAPRSSYALKGLDVGAGVIDSDYRGPVKVVMFNHTDQNFTITRGEKIAQMILEKIITPPVVCVQNLDTTERGAGGFGSTDIKKAT